MSSFFLKPFLTALFSPYYGRLSDKIYFGYEGDIREPFGIQYHFKNIFSYKFAFFIYSFMLALIIYFIVANNLNLSNRKSKTEFQKRVDKLNDLRGQNIITDQEQH